MHTTNIPCLRHRPVRYYAYSPLARGILTGKHAVGQPEAATHPFQEKYWADATFQVVEGLKGACAAHGFGLSEGCLR